MVRECANALRGAIHRSAFSATPHGGNRRFALKVLHVIPSLSPARGGPTEAVRGIAAGLVAAGVEVDIATTDDDGPDARQTGKPDFAEEGGVCVYRFPRSLGFYSFSPRLSSWLGRHAGEYDLLHIHALFNYPATAASFTARRRCIPYFIRPLGTLSEWGMRERRPLLKRISFAAIEKRILEHAALVHFTSEAERAASAHCGAKFRSVVIPNPVTAQARQAGTGDRLNVLFLSRFDLVKGLDLLLRSFAIVAMEMPGATLVLAGDGPADFVEGLRSQAQQLGIAGRIDFRGFLQGEAKERAFAEASVFVLPSRSESFGMAVVEAMAHGVPVIVSDRVPMHAAIVAEGAGLAVPRDEDALSYAMSSLLGNEEARLRMGERGREFVAANYSPRATADALIALYRQHAGHRA